MIWNGNFVECDLWICCLRMHCLLSPSGSICSMIREKFIMVNHTFLFTIHLYLIGQVIQFIYDDCWTRTRNKCENVIVNVTIICNYNGHK